MPKTETDIEKRNKYGMLCGIVGIFLNLILCRQAICRNA